MSPKRVNEPMGDDTADEQTVEVETMLTDEQFAHEVALEEMAVAEMSEGEEGEESESETEEEEDSVTEDLYENDVSVEMLTQAVEQMSLNQLSHLQQRWADKTDEAKDVAKHMEERLCVVAEKRRSILSAQAKSMAKAKAKAQTKAKAAAKKQSKRALMNVTVRYRGRDFVIQVSKYDRIKQVREELRRRFPDTFVSDTMVRKLVFSHNGKVLNDTLSATRTELGSHGVEDGSIILANMPGINDEEEDNKDNKKDGYPEDDGQNDNQDDKDNKDIKKKSKKKSSDKSKPSGSGASSSKDLNKQTDNMTDFIIILMEDEVKTNKFRFHYGKSNTFKEVVTAFQQLGLSVGCVGTVGEYAFHLTYGDSVVSEWETISSLTPQFPFFLKVRTLGGALVRNHVTKENLKKTLKQKAVTVLPKMETVSEEVTFPECFLTFLSSQEEKMTEVSVFLSQNVPLIRLALKTTSDGNLKTMRDILSTRLRGNRGESSEMKFLQSADFLVPSLLILESAYKSVKNLHIRFSKLLVECAIEMYSGSENFDGTMKQVNHLLLRDIETEQKNRSEQVSVANAPSNCVIN